MALEKLRFERIDPTWEATSPILSWWGEGGGSYEAHVFNRRGASLLRVFVYHLRVTDGAQKHMGAVYRLLLDEQRCPSSILGPLTGRSENDVRNALTEIVSARGSMFGDPVPYLLLNLDGEHPRATSNRWPLR